MSLFLSRWRKSTGTSGRTTRSRPLRLEMLEVREVLSTYRSIDGTGNNLTNPLWGSAGVDLLRISPTAYADGVSAPTVGSPARPSAREISNAVADQGDADIVSDRMLSAMIYAWGQFVDHDLDLTPNASPKESFNIQVPTGDPSFDPTGTGTQVIPLNRSMYDPATGTGTNNPRQQVNTITAWMDGSQIYGSDNATAAKLRTFVGGKLKTSDGNLLPLNDAATFPDGTLPMDNAGPTPSDQLFAAGDVRANENIELTSLHTLFVREHNRVADEILRQNPSLSDEEVYQRARQWVIGELQVITYKEWLPSLLGPNALKAYNGYNARVNPGIANEFSTALFRLGHSMLGDDVEFLDNNGLPVAEEIPLSEAFFNPAVVQEQGIGSILKYLASDPSSEIDTKVVESVRNFLFGPPGSGGLDLVSLNIQRGRDHGLADYNTMRAAYGLPKVTRFDQITSDRALAAKLQQLYGNVNNIDAWVGALAEKHVQGSSTGPLLQRALADQFQRIRDGDRFWYQRIFSGQDLRRLEQTRLSDIIRRNTEISNVQDNAFFFRVGISGTVFEDRNSDARRGSGEGALAGRKIELVNADSGEVVAAALTNGSGQFTFNTLNGLGVGRFLIREVLPDGWKLTTAAVPVIDLTRGESFRNGILIGNARLPAPKPAPTGTRTAASGSLGDQQAMQFGFTDGSKPRV